MNCSRFETLLTDFLEETLDPRVDEGVREHLKDCPACTTMLRQVKSLMEDLDGFPQLPVPEAVVDRILEQTTGKPLRHSFWQDLILPTLRPFMTQRFAFSTIIMFVFLALMANLLGPGFYTLGSGFKPSSIVEGADRVSDKVYQKWSQVRAMKDQFWEELKLLKEDLSGRLDYHLISILFESYNKSLQEQEQSKADKDQGSRSPEKSPESKK